jgi:RES domain-containing protein
VESSGDSVVYTAESLSLATLEIVVHLEREELFYTRFLKIPVTFDSSQVTTLSRNTLPKDWNRLPPSESTQKIGYKWISRLKFAVLKVPSTIIMEEYNYLINPNHPEFADMKIGKPQRFKFDPRLAGRH